MSNSIYGEAEKMTNDAKDSQIDDAEDTEILVTAELQISSLRDKSKKKKLKKGMFNRDWLKVVEYNYF
jgi:hypothetical protein